MLSCFATSRRKAARSKPAALCFLYISISSGSSSSPSPIRQISTKSATGSLLYVQGPPQTIMGASFALFALSSSMPARFSILSIFV